jgi:hypothetical protein
MIKQKISRDAYNLAREYVGLKEIDGTENNPIIALAHHLCRISVIDPTSDVDSSIPWCSSWVNLCVVGANARRNPKGTADMLRKKGFTGVTIAKVFEFAKVPIQFTNIDTGVEIIEPTWSANSKSWDTWGESMPFEHAERGDIIRFTRDGGGHVAFLDEDSLGKVMLSVFGGNQSNKVSSSNMYARSRLVHVRLG